MRLEFDKSTRSGRVCVCVCVGIKVACRIG